MERWVLALIAVFFCFNVVAEEFVDHLQNPPHNRMSGLQYREYVNQQRPRIQADIRFTKNGARFVRDYRFPALGEAWRDPNGMIWGDVAKNQEGKVRTMNHVDALAYCRGLGAALPSNTDFDRLREYMGGNDSGGYTPQVLPNMTDILRLPLVRGGYEEVTYSNYFWSRNRIAPDSTFIYGDHAWYLCGKFGEIDWRRPSDVGSVRCVVAP